MTQEIEHYPSIQTNRFLFEIKSKGNGINSNSIEIHFILFCCAVRCAHVLESQTQHNINFGSNAM